MLKNSLFIYDVNLIRIQHITKFEFLSDPLNEAF